MSCALESEATRWVHQLFQPAHNFRMLSTLQNRNQVVRHKAIFKVQQIHYLTAGVVIIQVRQNRGVKYCMTLDEHYSLFNIS